MEAYLGGLWGSLAPSLPRGHVLGGPPPSWGVPPRPRGRHGLDPAAASGKSAPPDHRREHDHPRAHPREPIGGGVGRALGSLFARRAVRDGRTGRSRSESCGESGGQSGTRTGGALFPVFAFSRPRPRRPTDPREGRRHPAPVPPGPSAAALGGDQLGGAVLAADGKEREKARRPTDPRQTATPGHPRYPIGGASCSGVGVTRGPGPHPRGGTPSWGAEGVWGQFVGFNKTPPPVVPQRLEPHLRGTPGPGHLLGSPRGVAAHPRRGGSLRDPRGHHGRAGGKKRAAPLIAASTATPGHPRYL